VDLRAASTPPLSPLPPADSIETTLVNRRSGMRGDVQTTGYQGKLIVNNKLLGRTDEL